MKEFPGKKYHPETLALGLGYEASRSEGSVKPPVFLTSTFQFESAEHGKHFFELAYGLKEKDKNESMGLIYSRINNPNLQIFEERMAAWDESESAASFASGMAAITTTILALVKPGDHIITSTPVYGGTHYFFEHLLPSFNIVVHKVHGGSDTVEKMRAKADEIGPEKVRMLYVETPANPSNILIDIAGTVSLSESLSRETGKKVYSIIDNTFLGPVFQTPSTFGVDAIIYSATKFIGGHSDLVAGVTTGKKEIIQQVSLYRTILGTMATPFSGWLLLRSLETLSVRMRRQAKNAKRIAHFLADHPQVKNVFYPGLLEKDDPQRIIYDKQCKGAGSLISFEIKGGESEAFRMLNSFHIIRLAVSLGGTESLIEHPMSMTHADVPPEELNRYGVTEGLVRLSVGIEHEDDLIWDIEQALKQI
jgi:methionine-gamma-lyase